MVANQIKFEKRWASIGLLINRIKAGAADKFLPRAGAAKIIWGGGRGGNNIRY
jgi:hypothetical protein